MVTFLLVHLCVLFAFLLLTLVGRPFDIGEEEDDEHDE